MNHFISLAKDYSGPQIEEYYTMINLRLSRTAMIVLVLSLVTTIFWLFVQFADVYKYAAVGAIVEIAWLPMIALLFILPLLSLYLWSRENFKAKSVFLFSFLLALATAVFVISRG